MAFHVDDNDVVDDQRSMDNAQDIYSESYYSSSTRQFVPSNIRNNSIADTGYFNRDRNWILGLFGALPYFIVLYLLLSSNVPLLPIIVISLIYLVVYSYFIRYKVLEERRLRKVMNEADRNRIGKADYFNETDKIDGKDGDDGKFYFVKLGVGGTIVHGYLVSYDRGSLINVPPDVSGKFKQVKTDFYRRLAHAGYRLMDFEVREGTSMPKQFERYMKINEGIKDRLIKQVITLNLNASIVSNRTAEKNYKEYFLISNTSYGNLANFRENLSNIIRLSLGSFNYIKHPHICTRDEVQPALARYYQQSVFPVVGLMRSSDYVALEQYVDVVAMYDENGHQIPFEVYNSFFTDPDSKDTGAGAKTLGDLIRNSDQHKQQVENKRVKLLNQELDKLKEQRRKEVIDDQEYLVERKKLLAKYDPKVYDPDLDRLVAQANTHGAKDTKVKRFKRQQDTIKRDALNRSKRSKVTGGLLREYYNPNNNKKAVAKKGVAFKDEDAKRREILESIRKRKQSRGVKRESSTGIVPNEQAVDVKEPVRSSQSGRSANLPNTRASQVHSKRVDRVQRSNRVVQPKAVRGAEDAIKPKTPIKGESLESLLNKQRGRK